MKRPDPPVPPAPLDLAAIEQELRQGDGYDRAGHAARTLARSADLRVVVVAIRAGHHIAEHQANATALIHVVSGEMRVQLPDRDVELAAGQLLVLESGTPHGVEARADGAIVLTLGNPGKKDGAT